MIQTEVYFGMGQSIFIFLTISLLLWRLDMLLGVSYKAEGTTSQKGTRSCFLCSIMSHRRKANSAITYC